MRHLVFFVLLVPILVSSQDIFTDAEVYFQQEQFGKAKILFQKYLKEHPHHQKTREYLGDIAGYTKEWDIAISYYDALVEEDLTNATYHFKYGAAMGMKALEISKIRALGYIGDIKEAFEEAARLDPNHIETRWALVEFYIQLPGIIGGSERKAIAYANQLAEISPVDGFLANGYIAEYSNRPAVAEQHYKNAIRVGGSFHTYEKLSNLYENNNQPKEAMAITSKSLKIHKRNQLNYQIGKIAAQYNLDAVLGIQSLEEYIKNHSVKDGVPKDWAYYRMAQIYKNMGQKKEALQWIKKALVSRPSFKEAKKEKKIIEAL